MTKRKPNQKRTLRKSNGGPQQQQPSSNQHTGPSQSNPTPHRSPIPQSTRYNVNGHLNRSNSSPAIAHNDNSQICLEWSEVIVKNGEMPARRGFHSCTCVGDKLYIIGGDAQSTFFSDVYTFNIVPQRWDHDERPLGNPRTGHTCVHFEGCLYLFGGKQSKILSNGSKQESYLSDLLVYDIARREWTKAESNIKLVPRGAHSCSVIESQKRMYIFGGLTPAYGNSVQSKTVDLEYLNSICVYDFEGKQWLKLRCKGDIPPMRAGHASCVVGEYIYVFGGRKGSNLLQDFYVLDTSKLTWKKIYQKNPPSTRAGHSMCYYPKGHSIILWGGGDWGRFFDDIWTFDVSDFRTTGEWQLQTAKASPTAPGARFWHTSVIHKDAMYIFGGGNKTNLFNDLFVLNLTPLAKSESARAKHIHKRAFSQPFSTIEERNEIENAVINSQTPTSRGTDIVKTIDSQYQSQKSQSTYDSDMKSHTSSTTDVVFGFTKIKTVYQGEMRILKVPYGITYNDLLERLRQEYKSNGVVVRYIDEEEDAITIRSDDELRSAGEYFQSFQKAPRFEIEIVKTQPTAPKTPISTPSSASRSKSPQTDHSDIAGEKTFNWTRGEKIGEGAYGTVYNAINTDTGEFMAAKHIIFGHVPQEERQRALQEVSREIELMKNIMHENIVQYLGVERHKNSLYIFLEYVSGGSLASLLKRFRLGEGTVRIYTRQILQGLKYLHEHEIVHRDIKGANILVSTSGVIKLADFGHSRVLEKSDASMSLRSQQNKSIRGTPMWMAPEVIQTSQHGKWSDVWSVGCVVVEMLSGSYPYPQLKNEDAMKVMWQIGHSDIRPTIPDSISEAGRKFLDRVFQRDHTKRATVDELLAMEFITQPVENAHHSSGHEGRVPYSPTSDRSQSEEPFDVASECTSSSEYQSYVSDEEEEEDDDDEYDDDYTSDDGMSEDDDTSTFESYVSDEDVSDDDDVHSGNASFEDQHANIADAQESLASIEKQMQNLRINKMLVPATRMASPTQPRRLFNTPNLTNMRSQALSEQLRQIRPLEIPKTRMVPSARMIPHAYGQPGRLPSFPMHQYTPPTTTTTMNAQQTSKEASEAEIIAYLDTVEQQKPRFSHENSLQQHQQHHHQQERKS